MREKRCCFFMALMVSSGGGGGHVPPRPPLGPALAYPRPRETVVLIQPGLRLLSLLSNASECALSGTVRPKRKYD